MAEKDRSGCCNPVKEPGPVSLDHVLAALRESKAERDTRIKSLFSFFDAANLGYLDSVQIEKGLEALQIAADYKFAKELLSVCDANRDGRVDYQEFRKYMDDKELELYRIFQAIDVEHNGCILPEELWDALTKVEVIPHRIVEHGLLSVESFTLPKVNKEASEKVLEVEQKFNEVRRPVYEKRNEIIRTIPDFWLNAFLSHPALGELLNHEDQQIFKFIESLHVEDFKDVKSGYSIAFNFKPNPYFEDTKLVKTFTFLDEGTTKIVGTPIKWKEGMGTENGGDCEKKGNKRPPADDRGGLCEYWRLGMTSVWRL